MNDKREKYHLNVLNEILCMRKDELRNDLWRKGV